MHTPGLKDTADLSSLPNDIYVVSAKTDGIVYDVSCCSVPMAIGPEVRYSLAAQALTKERQDAIYDAYRGLCMLKKVYEKWGSDQQVDATCDLLLKMGREFPFIGERVAQSSLRS
jgi:hypothetical protein